LIKNAYNAELNQTCFTH